MLFVQHIVALVALGLALGAFPHAVAIPGALLEVALVCGPVCPDVLAVALRQSVDKGAPILVSVCVHLSTLTMLETILELANIDVA